MFEFGLLKAWTMLMNKCESVAQFIIINILKKIFVINKNITFKDKRGKLKRLSFLSDKKFGL